jgi:DNA (cytosine-5)-methyltransferase 1
MMENVPGLKDHRLFRTFSNALQKLGYIVRCAVADVRHYGVAQRRRRLIVLAGRGMALQFASHARRMLSVRDVISELPPAGKSGDILHDYAENRSMRTKKLIARIPKNGGGRLDLPKVDQLPCHRRIDGYKDIYGRMSWDSVAPTITTGCYNPSKGRFLHPTENRCITMREAALLQGFPHAFTVANGTTKTQVARMLGNALPPEFIRRHALKIRRVILAQGL